ncbi:MAG: hypothetical protein SVX43_18230 [Cyanobacteriota bacterium]|nr:hypothetical protein [Cyanobacteriota bacterium]
MAISFIKTSGSMAVSDRLLAQGLLFLALVLLVMSIALDAWCYIVWAASTWRQS